MAQRKTKAKRTTKKTGPTGRKTTKAKTGKARGSRKKTPTTGQEQRLRSILEYIQPSFVEDGAKRLRNEDVTEIVEASDEVWREFRDGETLKRFKAGARTMISFLRDHHDGRYPEASLWSVTVVAFALRYVLKPIDIIPDSLPVIGQLDDAMVVSHALTMARPDLHAYRIWKLAKELDDA